MFSAYKHDLDRVKSLAVTENSRVRAPATSPDIDRPRVPRPLFNWITAYLNCKFPSARAVVIPALHRLESFHTRISYPFNSPSLTKISVCHLSDGGKKSNL